MSEPHSEVFRPNEQFVDGDVTDDRARLEQGDELVRQGQRDQPEALGQGDVEEDLGAGESHRFGGFDLPLADRLEATPEHFGLVADCV